MTLAKVKEQGLTGAYLEIWNRGGARAILGNNQIIFIRLRHSTAS